MKRVEKQVNKIIRKEKTMSVARWHEIIREEWEGISVDLCLNLVN
jgi:hypothetical protein